MSTHDSDMHSAHYLIDLWTSSPLPTANRTWPRLLWTSEASDAARSRVKTNPALAVRIRAEADHAIDDPGVFASEPAWHSSQQTAILKLARAAWLTEEERMVSLATRLIDRAASAETWIEDATALPFCDTAAASTAGTIARAMDLLAGRLTDNHIGRYSEAVREKCLGPFLAASRERITPWSEPGGNDASRITVCGHVGLAALGMCCAEDADLPEILAYATEGVVDVLQSSAHEGSGSTTELVALRYLLALAKIWPQANELLGPFGAEATDDVLLDLLANPER